MSKFDEQEKLQIAFSLHQVGKLEEAANIYHKIIERNPKNVDALHYLGVVEASLGNFERAKSFMARSLSIQPRNIQFVENYATILFQIGEYKSALQICQQGLQLNPANISLLYVSAISLFKLKQLQDSLTQFDRLLLLQPDHIAAFNERGSVLAEMKKYDAALASVEKALIFQPQYAEAHLNRGNLYSLQKRYDEAFAAYDKALALKPDLADAWLGRGNVFFDLKRHDEAFAAYDKALALKPDLADAWLGRGNVFSDLMRHNEAFTAYDKALALKPDLAYAEGARLHAKMLLCNWSNFDAECRHLISSVRGGTVTAPFAFQSISASLDDRLQCATLFNKDRYPASDKPIWQGNRYNHDRIRIAYLSADFRDHPVSYLLAGVFEQHDRKHFETIAISFGPDNPSEMRTRLKGAFDQFIDVKDRSDFDVARLLLTLEVDIAVDLMGYTANCRTAIFAHRPAPIQVNYLGHAGTMGASYMDYLIADPTLVPAPQQKYYAEKIAYLPNSYLPNDSRRLISDRLFDRAEFELPHAGFVFCCFNNSYKLNPESFGCWIEILKKVEGSVLWLSDNNSIATSNLKTEASIRGVNPERLVFAKRMELIADHLARHRLADLFLDTLPFNAHTTASDALWAELPVLTRIGETFESMAGASLLTAIGLPELITSTPQTYEDLAIELATNPGKLAAIKRTLANNRLTMPLFDTPLFTRHIEAAYTAMYERYQADLSPDHIYVPQ